MTKQQLYELSSKLVKKFGDEILNESFDFYSNLTSLIESGEIVDMDINKADILEYLCKKRAMLEYKNDAYSIVAETLEESDYVLTLMNESVASEKARRLGLKHKGFGWYQDPKNSNNIYKSTGTKLVKASNTVKKKSTTDDEVLKKRRKNAEEDDSVKTKKSKSTSTSSKAGSKTEPKDAKVKKAKGTPSKSKKGGKKDEKEDKALEDFHKGQMHITNVIRIHPIKYIYEFKLNGEQQTIELRKEEYSSERPISQIIYDKLKERKFEKGMYIPYDKTTDKWGLKKSYSADSKYKKRHFEDDEELPNYMKKKKYTPKKSSKKSEK